MVARLAAQDTVTLLRADRRTSSLLGKITAVSPTEVTVQTSGAERKIPVNEVRRIGLGDEPNGLRQARAALLAGQFEQAIKLLEGVELPPNADSILRQELGFCRVSAQAQLALQGGGDLRQAEADMRAFLVKERTTFHFFEIAEMMGHVARAAGDYANAARYYQQLAKAPWQEYELRSWVLLGGALRAQEKWDEAVAQFDRVLNANATDPTALRQQTLARIGKADCQAQQGAAATAISELQEVIAKNDPADEPLFAQAYVALGAAYRKAQKPLEAVLAYLHVDLLFYSQREAHAEALYYLTELWPQVDQPARAVEARQMLQSRYAGTVWAKRAG
jgi:tetratricopeptide (TPR) repeat protein